MPRAHTKLAFLILPVLGITWLARWAWTPAAAGCSIATRAVWIGAEWTDEPANEQAIKTLTRLHADHSVRDIYVYTAHLQADGQFTNTGDHLAGFARIYRRFNPDARILAWIGLPLKNDYSLGVQGWVDLSDTETRQNIVTYVSNVGQDAELDGVHLDVETVWDGDPNFLLLLQEIRAALGPDQVLSIAGSHWMPSLPGLIPVLGKFRWSSAYYRQVGEQVDQIAVMAYDSHLPVPALYRLWVREEITGIRKSLAPTNAELIVGLSASDEKTSSHHPDVETMAAGVSGICEALHRDSKQANKELSGIGVYASWEASEADWEIFEE